MGNEHTRTSSQRFECECSTYDGKIVKLFFFFLFRSLCLFFIFYLHYSVWQIIIVTFGSMSLSRFIYQYLIFFFVSILWICYFEGTHSNERMNEWTNMIKYTLHMALVGWNDDRKELDLIASYIENTIANPNAFK